MQRLEQLKSIAQKYFSETSGHQLLNDPKIKFNLFKEASTTLKRPFLNTELNNTQTLDDFYRLFSTSQEQTILQKRKETIQKSLEKMELPMNMHFVPSRHDLTSMAMRARTLKAKEAQSKEVKAFSV